MNCLFASSLPCQKRGLGWAAMLQAAWSTGSAFPFFLFLFRGFFSCFFFFSFFFPSLFPYLSSFSYSPITPTNDRAYLVHAQSCTRRNLCPEEKAVFRLSPTPTTGGSGAAMSASPKPYVVYDILLVSKRRHRAKDTHKIPFVFPSISHTSALNTRSARPSALRALPRTNYRPFVCRSSTKPWGQRPDVHICTVL